MKIGMILDTQFPPDIRVEKELKTMLSEHEVFLICPRRGNSPESEMWNGMLIRRIFTRNKRWWSNWQLMTTCYSKSWEREIDKYVKDHKLEALHVHDLPLLGTALIVAKKNHILVVSDLHENYPAMLEEEKKVSLFKTSSLGSLILRLSVSIKRWKAYEHEVVPHASAVITVIEEAQDRLIKVGVEPSKICVVGNYSSKYTNNDSDNYTEKSDTFRVVYGGGFGATRDLYTLVDAISILKNLNLLKLEVFIIGGANREHHLLEQYVIDKNLTEQVFVQKWIPSFDLEKIMDTAHIGLVPHVKSEHTDNTVPHKLFQYMARRLPVIVSNCIPLERIVNNSGCGLVYQTGNSQSLAACLKTIYEDPVAAKKMGYAGYAAVQEKFNWELAGANLLRIYRELAMRTPEHIIS